MYLRTKPSSPLPPLSLPLAFSIRTARTTPIVLDFVRLQTGKRLLVSRRKSRDMYAGRIAVGAVFNALNNGHLRSIIQADKFTHGFPPKTILPDRSFFRKRMREREKGSTNEEGKSTKPTNILFSSPPRSGSTSLSIDKLSLDRRKRPHKSLLNWSGSSKSNYAFPWREGVELEARKHGA